MDWRPVFIAALAEHGNVSAAARKAHINRDTAYAAKATEDKQGAALIEAQAFARQWQEALEVATDALEMEARRRALRGVSEPVGWYQGESGGTVQRYSDTLMIFLLKAHRPEKFGERIKQVHEGEIGVNVLTPEQMEARRQARWQQVAPALATALSTANESEVDA